MVTNQIIMQTDRLHILQDELALLNEIISERLRTYLSNEKNETFSANGHFNQSFLSGKYNVEEQVTLLIALAPHIQPNFFDAIIQKYFSKAGNCPNLAELNQVITVA